MASGVLREELPGFVYPKHIVIIPDGNGRWAKQRGKFVTQGHRKGLSVAHDIIIALSTISQIKILTIWGFSADNWKRSEKEVKGLMMLLGNIIKKTLKDLQKRNGRFIHLGRKDRIPHHLLRTIEAAEQSTRENSGQIVCLAIDFGGTDQDIRVLQKALLLDKQTIVNEDTLWKLRDGHGLIPSADLLIRTSGEVRISDIGWLNGAQTELYFLPKFFPDVTQEDILHALGDFSKRERRMGGRVQ